MGNIVAKGYKSLFLPNIDRPTWRCPWVPYDAFLDDESQRCPSQWSNSKILDSTVLAGIRFARETPEGEERAVHIWNRRALIVAALVRYKHRSMSMSRRDGDTWRPVALFVDVEAIRVPQLRWIGYHHWICTALWTYAPYTKLAYPNVLAWFRRVWQIQNVTSRNVVSKKRAPHVPYQARNKQNDCR